MTVFQGWHTLSRIGRLAVVSGLAVPVFAIGLLLAYFTLPAIGGVSGKALQSSLADTAGGGGSYGLDECLRRGREAWRCEVSDASGSGSASFVLRTDAGRCWHARKTTPDDYEEGPPMERTPSGCVKWNDQLRPWDRLLG